jgi:hypothetical protein
MTTSLQNSRELTLTVLAALTLASGMVAPDAAVGQIESPRQRARSADFEPPPAIANDQTARTADTVSGRIGKRQTREAVARKAGTEPMARIANRINNRVQSRIRNRIDQDYDPQANAASPFAVASDQARAAANRRRR